MPFKYQPSWQGPLSGRSFEKQTEDFLNGIESRVDEIDTRQTPSDAVPMAPGTGSPGTSGEYSRGDHSHPLQASVAGNAGTADALSEAREISFSGEGSGSNWFSGASDVSLPLTVACVADGSTERRQISSRFADLVNVKDFGAAGDGATDDTAAFQAAAAVGRTLFCPNGIYVVNGDVDATATGFEFIIAGTHNLHVRHLNTPQVPAESSAGNLLNQVQYTLGDARGSIRLLPTKLQPHGVLLKYGTGSGTNVRVEFDEPFPKTCLGVVGTISANPLNTTQISMFRTLNVDQAGFTAIANFYNPANGNYGTPAESYFWFALGY